MLYLCIGFCVLYCLLELFLQERVYRPSFTLVAIWGLILIMHSFEAYGLPRCDERIYLIIFCSLVSFIIGSSVVKGSNRRIVINGKELFQKTLRRGTYKFLVIVFFVLMFIPLIKAGTLLIGGTSLYDIRYTFREDILGNGIIAIMFNYYCEPFLTCMIVCSVTNLFSENLNKKYILITLVGLIFMTIISGGRFFILYFIGALFIGILLYTQKSKASQFMFHRLHQKRARFLVIVAVIAIVVVSIVRGADIAQTSYVYLCGGLPFLDHLVTRFSSVGFTYGSATLYGFMRPLFVILRKIGICDFPAWMTLIQDLYLKIDQPYLLGEQSILFNSFSTAFLSPYLDGGFLGSILVFLILGAICESVYRRIDIRNEYIVSWFLLIELVVLLSFFRLTITHYSFALAFVYLFVVHKKTERN